MAREPKSADAPSLITAFFREAVTALKGRPEYILAAVALFAPTIVASVTLWKTSATDYVVLILCVLAICSIAVLLFIIAVERNRTRSPAVQMTDRSKPSFKKKGVTNDTFQGFLTNHENKAFRDEAFSALKSKACTSILMMGVGMTNLHPDHIEEKYLRKGINVRLLMMNPKILLSHFDFERHLSNGLVFTDSQDAFHVLLKETHIDEYFRRKQYFSEVTNSFVRLKSFTADIHKRRKEGEHSLASLEMRVFNSFIPMSITAINELAHENAEVPQEFSAEFLLPFSAKRIMVPFSREATPAIYAEFIKSITSVWDQSTDVLESDKIPIVAPKTL